MPEGESVYISQILSKDCVITFTYVTLCLGLPGEKLKAPLVEW